MGGIKPLFYTTLILIKDKKYYEGFFSLFLLALRKEAIYHSKVVSLAPGAVLEDEAFLIHLKGCFFFYYYYFEQRKRSPPPHDFTDGRILVLKPTLEVSSLGRCETPAVEQRSLAFSCPPE